ncbi:ATP-binding cassette domain-containing protein [Neolewinella aquimaris]|uniref:ATP-binding cassette domain-containing protein n=1 Tax=Neolewinella aquimaris TaxID=1835722 RepID=UPI0021D0667A|nr:ATP-binding cassette domain-containing protein [Neolewinella aquimaris]
MSVSVQNLTKAYGDQLALDGISFTAAAGEVLGFLGPNGAGKTTTMKILTCYLSQTAGTAEVCGHDVATDSLAVRRLVGYLPEHNPPVPGHVRAGVPAICRLGERHTETPRTHCRTHRADGARPRSA